jgi:hypothetical protein
MAADKFAELKWLPDPCHDPTNTWHSFEELYGTETNDHQRPSFSTRPGTTGRDANHKCLLVSGIDILF